MNEHATPTGRHGGDTVQPHSTIPAHHAQLTWALSQRPKPWPAPDRYLLLQMIAMAVGHRRVRASDSLLSGLTGVPTPAVTKALDRMTSKSILRREESDDGREYIVLLCPTTNPPNGDVCAHVRGEGGA